MTSRATLLTIVFHAFISKEHSCEQQQEGAARAFERHR
jgi:hypothetical protein